MLLLADAVGNCPPQQERRQAIRAEAYVQRHVRGGSYWVEAHLTALHRHQWQAQHAGLTRARAWCLRSR